MAPTDGTQRPFTKAILDQVMQTGYQNGAGRVQGADYVPYVPEDELVKIPSRFGPAIHRGGWRGTRGANPEFTYDGRAAVSGMRDELDPYQGFDTPKERLALEREAPSRSLENLHDKREAQQMWPTRPAPMTTAPASDRVGFWQRKIPDLVDLFTAGRRWRE